MGAMANKAAEPGVENRLQEFDGFLSVSPTNTFLDPINQTNQRTAYYTTLIITRAKKSKFLFLCMPTKDDTGIKESLINMKAEIIILTCACKIAEM